ncbi:hypothetical protein AURDEDRAFT_186391 [Auricularia subglabra TFB-10046 SS5]|nr:hypothetical protein AURDEDRAFT_186391 [Auricularia subglabra TFB-10046 SS5]
MPRISLSLVRSPPRLDAVYCSLLVVFGLLVHAGYGQARGYISSSSSAHLFAVALLQCTGCLVLHARVSRRAGWDQVPQDDTVLPQIGHERVDDKELPPPHSQIAEKSASWLPVAAGALAALVSLASVHQLVYSGAQLLFAFKASLPLALALYTSLSQPHATLVVWQALVIQLAGLLLSILASGSFSATATNPRAVLVLSGIVLLYTYAISLFAQISCTTHSSRLYLTDALFFIPAVLVHGLAATATGFEDLRLATWCLPLVVFEAAIGMLALRIIREAGAVSFGVWNGVSAACLLLLTRSVDMKGGVSFLVLLGCGASFWAAWTYFHSDRPDSDHDSGSPRRNILASTELAVLAIIVLGVIYSIAPFARPDAEGHRMHSIALPPTRLPHCARKPLASHGWLRGKPRTFHAFDDVLLVVFFSHARYDANVDFYRDVYAEFFPNVVFVGPASREDAGFAGSYDILVDSYKSDENLTTYSEFRMAGRMAHHMLYTAMAEHDCYGGYLWAPFDTLLNVPRLLQFDQNRIWYHSPVVADYVPNPAQANATGKHAPAANIGPDPDEPHPNWSLMDGKWWYVSPYVGLPVCMPAYAKAPEAQRARLSSLTAPLPRPRLIGGSSDTAYIPGRLRAPFLRTLGLFLDTDCFMEIALPTTLHLVLPPGERMQFVDHWWIWQPPFSAEFVRKQWREGFEVDTFHTFHWGERNVDGDWKPLPQSVPDVRRLQAESARRQGVPWRRIE